MAGVSYFARASATSSAGHGAALRLSHQSPGYNQRAILIAAATQLDARSNGCARSWSWRRRGRTALLMAYPGC